MKFYKAIQFGIFKAFPLVIYCASISAVLTGCGAREKKEVAEKNNEAVTSPENKAKLALLIAEMGKGNYEGAVALKFGDYSGNDRIRAVFLQHAAQLAKDSAEDAGHRQQQRVWRKFQTSIDDVLKRSSEEACLENPNECSSVSEAGSATLRSKPFVECQESRKKSIQYNNGNVTNIDPNALVMVCQNHATAICETNVATWCDDYRSALEAENAPKVNAIKSASYSTWEAEYEKLLLEIKKPKKMLPDDDKLPGTDGEMLNYLLSRNCRIQMEKLQSYGGKGPAAPDRALLFTDKNYYEILMKEWSREQERYLRAVVNDVRCRTPIVIDVAGFLHYDVSARAKAFKEANSAN